MNYNPVCGLSAKGFSKGLDIYSLNNFLIMHFKRTISNRISIEKDFGYYPLLTFVTIGIIIYLSLINLEVIRWLKSKS